MAQNRIDWTFGFNIDKNGLSEINKQLDAVKAKANDRSLMGALNGNELKKVTKDAEKLKEILNQSWNPKLNQLDLSKVNNGLKQANLSAENLRNTFSKIGPTGVAAFNQFSSTILNTNMQIKQSSKLLDDMATTFKNTVRYGISSSVFNNLSNSIQKAYNYTKALDTSLNDIRIVTGYSADEMEKFAVSANKVAKDLGRSTKDFTEASLIYYQQGLGAEEAQARAEVTLKAANVTGQTGREVSEQLTAVWNGYKVTAEEAELYVDKLAAVAAATAADLEELSTGMSKVASAANLMGVDVDQLNAQLATIVSVTRQAPESVGVALKTIYARMSDIKSGLDDETTLGNYTEKMAQYGINVLDANGRLRDMGEVIEEIGGKWNSLSREQQIALSQVMAGTRQYNNLLSLFDNWDQYEKALETSANAAGTLQKQQDIYMESTEAHLQKLRTEAERTYDVLFDQDSVNSFADTLTNMLSVFNNFLEGIGGGTNAVVFFGTTLANVFNKQVAASIERQIENIEVLKANASAAELKASNLVYSELGTSIRAQQAEAGNSITSVGLQEEVKIAKEILSVKELLTEEEYNNLTAIQHQVGLDTDRLKYLQDYKKTAEDYINTLGKGTGVWKETLKLEEAEQKTLLADKDLRENYLRSLERGEELSEDELWTASQLVENLAEQTDNKEKQNTLVLAANKIMGSEKLDQKEILTILDVQNEKLQKNAINIEVLKNGTKGLKDVKEEEYNLEQKINLETQAVNAKIDPKKRQQIIAEGVAGLTSLVSLTISLSGVIKTINDDSLSATEKFERILPVLLTAAPQLIIFFKYMSSIIPTLGIGFKALGDSVAATATKMLGFTVTARQALLILAPVVALLTTIGIAAYNYAQKQDEANNKLIKANEAAEKATQELNKTKEAYENLQSSIEKYEGAEKALKKLTEGSIEWKKQIIELNEIVLDLLDKYPQLVQYIQQDKNGVMSIASEGYDQLLEEQQKQYVLSQMYQSQKRIDQIKAQSGKATDDMRKTLNNSDAMKSTFNNQIFTKMSDSDIQKLANVVSTNQDIINKGSNQDIINLLEKNNIDFAKYNGEINSNMTYAVDSLVENNHALIEYNNKLGEYTNQIGVYTNSIVTIAANESPEYAASSYKALINPSLENAYDKLYQSGLERWNEASLDTVRQEYKDRFGTEKDNTYGSRKWFDGDSGFYLAKSKKDRSEETWITAEEAREKLAESDAQKYTSSLATPNTIFVEGLIKNLEEESKNKNLGEALNAYKSGTNLNTLYNKDQLKDLQKSFESLDADSQKDIGTMFGENFSEGFKAEVENTLNNFDPTLYAQSMEASFNDKIKTTASDMKEKYELDEQDFIDYANQLSDIAADKVYDTGDKLADTMKDNAKATSIVAKSVMRMNKGIDELANNWKDWNSILKKSSASSEEYSKALNGTRDALGDLLDVEDDAQKYFTNKFIQEHLKEIGKAAEGDAKAIDDLRSAFAQDVILQIYAENNIDFSKIDSETKSLVNNLQKEIPNVRIGAELDSTKYADFLDKCQQIVKSAQMTEEQANAFFGAMGFDAEFETETKPVKKTGHGTRTVTELKGEMTVPMPDGTEMTIPAGYETKTYPGEAYDYVDYVDVVAMGTKAPDGKGGHSPIIKSLTKKGTGVMNNYSPSNKGGTAKPGGKSGGSGKKGKSGGSKKDPDKMDKIKEEKDRYHQVDVQLKLIENDLEKLENANEKAFGKAKIELLNQELKKYDEQISRLNEKIKIANGETNELRKKLSKQGVKFGADGAISNYVAAIQAQENAVNKLIDKYNKMSASKQEKYKDTIEKEKENFEEFKKNIDRYDELVSSFIPDLQQNIQDAIDKQVDIQIEEFDMEIEIRLNLKEAQQDWNKFRKEVLEDFDKDNPIGDLFKDYEDLKTLLAEDGNGLAQSLGRQLKNTLNELYKMDEGKTSDVYGADRVKALEDLKKYLDESIAALEEIEDLEDAIHEDFINNMDAIQDRFDKQIDDYETISKLLEHDKKVIELVSGDDAYKQLSRFYDEQDKNYKQQLAFQNQQVIFWREQLDTLDKSSDEWAEAKEKWEDAVDEYNDLIESSIENLQDKYLNTIKDIFNDLNNRLSGGRGLEGMNDQWQLLNMQSEEYLDNVNGIYKTQELANKYLDAIDNTSNIKAQQRLRDIMDDELDNLRARDQLSEYDLERAELRYQIAVKQIALEEAQQNKNRMRLRRDTQGNYRYEYVADDEQLAKSKQEISDFYNQLYNLDAQKYSENLEKVYNLTKDAEDKIQELYEDTTLTNEERQERILETTQYYAELIDQLTADNEYIKQNLQESTISELFDLYDVNKDNYEDMTRQQQDILNNYLKNSEDLTNAAYDNLFNIYNENIENFKNMTDAEINNLMNELIPGWDSAYQQMIDSLNAEGGFVPATEEAYEQASVAAENYYNEVIELANQSNEANQQAIDTIDKMREADEAVLEVARQEMEEGTKYLDYLSELTEARKADAEAAKAQTKAAYEYWQEQQRQAAEAAKKEAEKKKEEAAKKAEENKKSTSTKTSTTSNGSKSSSNSSGGGKGDGKLSVGDKATYTGKYYYDSKGTAPAGSRYSGVKNGIIIDRVNNNAYGIHIKSADGKYSDLGWVKKSQLSGYDTGGYTGTWGKDGRLALLHQKELVLNSTDTQNMLDAVKVIRQITDSLGSNILSRLADISSAGMGNLITNNDALNQNVYIEANFPNAKSHNEIEEALNNLVNAAAHRVNKK